MANNKKATSKAKKVSAKPAAKPKKSSKPASKVKAKPAKLKAKAKEKPAKKLVVKAAKKIKKKAAPPAKPVPKKATVAEAKVPEVKAKGKQKAQQIIREALNEAAMTALPEKEVILTNADGLRYCKVADCDELATSDSYCRFHYLLNWKKIQLRKRILAGDKLDRYIEELTARYPDKYLEMIRKDLANEKDFLAAIQELEIDDNGEDVEFEDDARTYIDEVRGVSTGAEDDEF